MEREGSFNRLRQCGGIEGKRLAIGGLGPSGLVAVQLAPALGARMVIGLDPVAQRRRLAQELGADEVWDPGEYLWPSSSAQNSRFQAMPKVWNDSGLKKPSRSCLTPEVEFAS
jgi:threonine dehydrogenase-like Zn-dependent dehydrogenase